MFGVIYSVDVPRDNWFAPTAVSIKKFDPSAIQRGTWTRTECTGGSSGENEWSPHGKWVAVLTKEQAKTFFDHFGFECHTLTETQGALGMPGADPWYGWAPAWSVDAPGGSAWVNAYITPWPDIKYKTGKANSAANWNRIRRAMQCLF